MSTGGAEGITASRTGWLEPGVPWDWGERPLLFGFVTAAPERLPLCPEPGSAALAFALRNISLPP